MPLVRALLASGLLLVTVLVQASRLGSALPGGPPQLVVVAVVALGLAGGPGLGAVAGFGAGVLADLLPPAAGPLGLSALVLVAAGWVAGVLARPARRLPTRLSILAAATVLALAAATGLAVLLGGRPGPVPALVGRWSAAAAYDVLLGLVVLPAVAAASRRLGRPAVRGYSR